MGITESYQSTSSKYTYFQTIQDKHFGLSKIYRTIQSPNQFALTVQRYLPQQQINIIQQNIKFFKTNCFRSYKQSPFLKIIDFSISNKQNNISNKIVSTCKIPQVTIWVEFLRHNLKEFMHWRRTQNRPLSIDQIIMALNKAILAYQMTKNNQIFGVNLNLQNISVTINGQMKFNPLFGKSLAKQLILENNCSGFKSCQTSPLRERIIQRRTLKSDKQNIPPRFINSISGKRQINYISPYLSQDCQFLNEIKRFVNQLVWDHDKHINRNDYQNYQLNENIQAKKFLNEFHKLKTLKQAKLFLGQSRLNIFYVDFAKMKHQESQAKFEKILSQIQQRSQKTDYSNHQSFNYISPVKNNQKQNFHLMTSQYYHYS